MYNTILRQEDYICSDSVRHFYAATFCFDLRFRDSYELLSDFGLPA